MNIESQEMINKLNSITRSYVYSDFLEINHKKIFRYINQDAKLLSLSREEGALISDCYIMYAIGCLGICDTQTIDLFLQTLQKKSPSLNIISGKNGGISERLRLLKRLGFLYNFMCAGDGDKKIPLSLYTLTNDGFELVKQQIQKRVPINSYIQAKPLYELVGWSSAAYTGSRIAYAAAGFDDFLERVLRTKQIGAAYFPCEIKIKSDDFGSYTYFYVACISSYLFFDNKRLSTNDFNGVIANKLSFILNYLNCRVVSSDTVHKEAVVVVTVQDEVDLNFICSHINKQHSAFEDHLSHIYFTGEGILRHCEKVEDCFLQMRFISYDADDGYELYKSEPIFI